VSDTAGGEKAGTPIVAVTAHALTAVHERVLAVGMNDFLVKPYDESQLAATLRKGLPDRERPPAAAERAASAPVPDADDQAIDASKIEEIRAIKIGGSETLLQRVISQFTSTAPGLAAAIRAKAGEGDSEAVWRAAHTLKSSAGAIGARRLHRHCADIEAMARLSGVDAVKGLLDRLDLELATATQDLQTLT
jgi:HPt (histidine-containing phosphotransfer) domain-containing protein